MLRMSLYLEQTTYIKSIEEAMENKYPEELRVFKDCLIANPIMSSKFKIGQWYTFEHLNYYLTGHYEKHYLEYEDFEEEELEDGIEECIITKTEIENLLKCCNEFLKNPATAKNRLIVEPYALATLHQPKPNPFIMAHLEYTKKIFELVLKFLNEHPRQGYSCIYKVEFFK